METDGCHTQLQHSATLHSDQLACIVRIYLTTHKGARKECRVPIKEQVYFCREWMLGGCLPASGANNQLSLTIALIPPYVLHVGFTGDDQPNNK